jgi:hypothetical protein
MVRGKPLSDDLCSVILNMACHLDAPAIRHSIRDVLLDYRDKGTILQQQLLKQTLRGKKRAFTLKSM